MPHKGQAPPRLKRFQRLPSAPLTLVGRADAGPVINNWISGRLMPEKGLRISTRSPFYARKKSSRRDPEALCIKAGML